MNTMIESVNEVKCCSCDKTVKIAARTTEHPADPEFLKPHVDNPDAWMAMMCTDQGHKIAVTCSDECMLKLFAEAFDQALSSETDVLTDETKVDTEPAPPAE